MNLVKILCPLALLTASCNPPDAAAPVAHPEEPMPEQTARPMEDHFAKATTIKSALVDGNLEAVAEPAQWLVDNVTAETVPVRWKPHVPQVRRAAKRILAAKDVAEAAQGTADLGAACGSCHEDVGVSLNFEVAAAPLKDDTTFGHMSRHGWAVDRMWEGLIAPSDERWTQGATQLVEAPLSKDKVPAQVSQLADGVHALAVTAKDATKAAKRGEHFGEILTSCAACHQVVNTEG